jgi:mannose-1-phosphate guanylyltransferase
MQAVIIAGGKGTRLKPLTYRCPKPMLPLLDQPFLAWMVERCRLSGITDILINVHYQAHQIEAYFGDGSAFGVQVRYIREEQPLGTAGAMKLAEPYFSGETLVVFNADILTDLDLGALIRAHREGQAQATIALARVDNPTAYGLVELEPLSPGSANASSGQRVRAFREKPTAAEAQQLGIDTINAGTYVLEPGIFEAYPADQPLSFEHAVFPNLLAQGQRMLGFVWEGYWMDLGTPLKYYQGHLDILSGKMPYDLSAIAQEQGPAVWVAPSAEVDPEARLEGPCFIGEKTYLGPEARIGAGTLVGSHSWINQTMAAGLYASGTLALSQE